MITFEKPPHQDLVTKTHQQCMNDVIIHVHNGGCAWDYVDAIVDKNNWRWAKCRLDGRGIAAMIMTLDKISDM